MTTESSSLDNPSHSLLLLLDRPWVMLRTSYDVFLFVSSNFVFLIFLVFSSYPLIIYTFSPLTPLFSIGCISIPIFTHTPCFGWLLGKTFPQTGRSCETHKKNKITWTARNRDKYEIPITKMCRSENETKNPQLFPLLRYFFFQVACLSLYSGVHILFFYFSFLTYSSLPRAGTLTHEHVRIHELLFTNTHRRAEAPESVDFEFKKNSHSP